MDQPVMAKRTPDTTSDLRPGVLAFPPEAPDTMSRSAYVTPFPQVGRAAGSFARDPRREAVGAGDVVLPTTSTVSGEGTW
jgi:hypothetical protein